MEVKKQQILESASVMFLKKGYPKTSMQDVAEACNVSKATLYKLFHSKESMGMMVIFHLTEQMIGKVEKITSRKDLSAKEILRECIIMRMEFFAERNRFMDELLFSLAPEQREKYFMTINRVRFNTFRVFLEIIMKAFQMDSETLACELTLNLNGLIKEVSFIAGEIILDLEDEVIADFIVDSLEAIMDKRAGHKSLLTQAQLEELRQSFEIEEKLMRPIFKKKRMMQSLKGLLEDYEKNGDCGSLEDAEILIKELKGLEESEAK